MFCPKCGKEIKDNDQYCQYCGKPLKTRRDKRGVFLICILLGLVVLLGGVSLAMKGGKNNKKEETKKEETYPKTISFDAPSKEGVTRLLDLLSKMDASESGHRFEKNKVIDRKFATSFLLDSIWFEVPFANGERVKNWTVSEEIVKNYLQSSIGIEEFEQGFLSVEDGLVMCQGVQVTCAYGNDQPQITKVQELEKGEIEVYGSVNYTPEISNGQGYKADFHILLIKNPDSMWGGYTLKEIIKWEEAKKENVQESDQQEKEETTLISKDKKEKIKELLFLLGEVDYRGSRKANVKELFEHQKEIFGHEFLFFTMHDKFERLKEAYHAVDYDSYWEMRDDKVEIYLQESVGSGDFVGENVISASEGFLAFAKADPPYVLRVQDVKIGKIKKIQDHDILVEGSMYYKNIEKKTKKQVTYQVVLRENENSIWGGYTLKEIRKWGEKETSGQGAVQKKPFHLLASSTLQQEGYNYSVDNLSDGNAKTCWAEGVIGIGEGESILFSSEKDEGVSGLAILPGYFKSEKLFYENGMPFEIEIHAGGEMWKKTFDDFQPDFSNPMDSMIYVDFGKRLQLHECKVTLKRCAGGEKYEDICITEMFLYDKVS